MINKIRYTVAAAAVGLLLGFAAPAMAAPAAPATSSSPAAAAKKNAVATSTSTITTFSKGKYVTLKSTDPKGKNQTYYINKSTVIDGTLAKGATATVTYNPNNDKKAKVWAVKIAVKK